MVRIGGILVCMLVVAMDVAAGFLGIQAEIAQNKVKHLRLWIFECREPSEDAFKLGLAAAGILVLAHVIANFLGGCACICSQQELQRASPHRQLSVACFLFSWIILAAGLSMLGIGTLSNNKSRTSCGFTHHHFFSFGGILCFVHGLFCVAYYVSATVAEKYPQKPWPKDQIWSFKNSPKVFGRPMPDAVLNNAPLDREMGHWLKNTPTVYQAMWDR